MQFSFKLKFTHENILSFHLPVKSVDFTKLFNLNDLLFYCLGYC